MGLYRLAAAAALCVYAIALASPANAAAPMRIVSLAPSVTETLFALGAGSDVVGVSQYCDYPPQVRDLPRVGSFLTPNLEAIIALRPTLVVGLELSSDVRQIRALNSMGYPVLLVSDDSLQQIESSIEKVGARINREDEAHRLVAQIRAQIAAVQKRLANVKPERALMLVGHQPIVAVGTGTYLDELMRIARADNIAEASASSGRISAWSSSSRCVPRSSSTVRWAPIPRRRVTSGKNIRRFPRCATIACSATPRIRCCMPGPRVGQSLEIIARKIHPEAWQTGSGK